MTPEQWYRYGGCPTCEAKPGKPCTPQRWGLGDDLEAPHPARPLYASTDDISRLLDDVVTMSVNEGVVVHPGDTLIVKLDPQAVFPDQVDTMMGELESIRAHIEARMPRGARVCVIAMDGQLGVVRAQTETSVPPSGPAAAPTEGQLHAAGPDEGCVPGATPKGAAPAVAGGPCCPEYGRTGYAHTEVCPAVQAD